MIVVAEEHVCAGADLPCPLVIKLVFWEPWAKSVLEPEGVQL